MVFDYYSRREEESSELEPWEGADAREIPKEVEAIENGKIVKVREDYAKREGLLVLRKEEKQVEETQFAERHKRIVRSPGGEKKFLSFDDFRKPLRMKDNQVYSELIDNFHWEISKARKKKGLLRRQVAKEIGIDEADLKLIENGVYPDKDFVLINKIQNYYGINLRKDKKDDVVFDQNMRKLAEETKKEIEIEQGKIDLTGNDIEIVEIDSEV